MTSLNIDLNSKIQEKIKLQTPRPKWQYQILDAGRVILFVVLIALSILSLASFLNDMFEFSEAYNQPAFFVPRLFTNLLFELVLFAIICGSMIFLIYRQTDWPLVRNKVLLFTAIAAAILIPGLILAFGYNLDLAPDLPYRQNRREQIQTFLREQGVFVGKITSVTEIKNDARLNGSWLLIAENGKEKIELISPKKPQNDQTKGAVRIEFTKTKEGDMLITTINPAPRQRIQNPQSNGIAQPPMR